MTLEAARYILTYFENWLHFTALVVLIMVLKGSGLPTRN